jgi:DNA-binding beta-propeller fold protein YncE
MSYESNVAQYTKKVQSKEEKSCEQCIDASSGPAVSLCMECRKFLCKFCCKHHKISRDTLNHELQPVDSIDLKALKAPHQPMSCQLHADEILKFYCENCSALICRDCRDLHHKGHNVDRVEQMAKKEGGTLQSTQQNTDSAKAKLDSAIADGDKVIQCLQGKQKSIEHDIDGAFKALEETLQQRKKALLAKATEISVGKQTALTIQGEKFKNLHKELVEISGMITKATDPEVYTPVEMLSAKGAITNKLQQLLKEFESLDLLPCKSDIMPNVLDTSELTGKISSFGLVLGGSYPGEAKTDLHIPRAIIDKQKSVTITTCDIQGKPFPYGDERVEVTLSLLGSSDRPLSAKVVDNKNGTYRALFTPRNKGEHQLSICIDSHHIKGSPFPMYMREAKDYTKGFSSQKSLCTSSTIYDVAVNDNGDVYAAVRGNNRIEVFDKEGKQFDDRTIGTSGDGEGQFKSPSAIAIRGSTLYVADSKNYRMQKLTTSGTFLSKFGDSQDGKDKLLKNPRGVCLDIDGQVYVSDGGNNRVSVFEADGKFLYHIIGATDKSKLKSPWGIALDQCGNLHVVDPGTNNIKIFTRQGQYVDEYYSGLSSPAGIAIDVEGNTFISSQSYRQPHSGYYVTSMCVLNAQHHVVYTHSFGNIPHGAGITIDKEGVIYFCAYGNSSCIYKCELNCCS